MGVRKLASRLGSFKKESDVLKNQFSKSTRTVLIMLKYMLSDVGKAGEQGRQAGSYLGRLNNAVSRKKENRKGCMYRVEGAVCYFCFA